ncbi:DUF2190 family protein [Agrobacterium pusense]|uniref:DUF2190 family protein n=1 Tax=Agrobacterium pusense TaxID=648995 RepID=UPI0010BE6BC5|nr:DUF2190 family protein [Agrobacterium pusense]QCL83353.1 DUF2190 family protein [Agrobacterium pusense]
MRNYIAEGNAITVVTPAGGYQSGNGYVVENLFGVAIKTTVEGEKNELYTSGVYSFPGEGDLFKAAYFDADTGDVTDTETTGLYKIGVIVGSGTDTVEVRLNGTDVVAEA